MDVGKCWSIGLIVPILVLSSPQKVAEAAELPGAMQYEATTESGISFAVVPFYIWLPGTKGTVGVFSTSAKVHVTPIDIVENLGSFLKALDGLYFGAGEVRYGKLGALYDVVYLDVSSTNEIGSGFISGTLDVGFSEVMATIAGTYRFMETPVGYLDAVAGARIWDINTDVGLDLKNIALHKSGGDTWIDPLVGIRARLNLSENVYLSGWTLIGGFGAGSDFMWDVWGNLGYQVNGWFDLFAGFRVVGADRKSGSFIWDITQYGPMMGATIKLN